MHKDAIFQPDRTVLVMVAGRLNETFTMQTVVGQFKRAKKHLKELSRLCQMQWNSID